MKQKFSNEGESFKFIGMRYNVKPYEKLELGDEVIIHPVPCKSYDVFSTTGFKSQATKSYPAKIITKEIAWSEGEFPNHKTVPKMELCLEGTGDNLGWHGAVLNEWGFNRLEFIKRSSVILSQK